MKYQCEDCGIEGVKLWREYNVCLEGQTLRCKSCAEKEAGWTETKEQRIARDPYCSLDQIGSMVPAVPNPLPKENGKMSKDATFWGYASVPQAGVDWWLDMPGFLTRADREKFFAEGR